MGKLVGVEQWDEGRFLRYMDALKNAGTDFPSATRLQIVHRTLLRNADRNIGGGSELKKEELKKHFDEMATAEEYLEASRLCFFHISVALRLQVLVSRAGLSKDEQLACAGKRPALWGELCRRINAVLISKALFLLTMPQFVIWHRMVSSILEIGKAYTEDEKLHAKQSNNFKTVVLRFLRQRHAHVMAKMRSLLCSESWEFLSVVHLKS